MSEKLFLLTISLILGTVLIIFGMKYLSAVRQAKTRTLAGVEKVLKAVE